MNPFFNAMGGNKQPNMMQQFQQFMNQMKGKDPNAVIQDMMQSGKITQDQYNQARQQAQQQRKPDCHSFSSPSPGTQQTDGQQRKQKASVPQRRNHRHQNVQRLSS